MRSSRRFATGLLAAALVAASTTAIGLLPESAQALGRRPETPGGGTRTVKTAEASIESVFVRVDCPRATSRASPST